MKRWDGIQSELFFFERELLHDGKKVRVDHRFFQKGCDAFGNPDRRRGGEKTLLPY